MLGIGVFQKAYFREGGCIGNKAYFFKKANIEAGLHILIQFWIISFLAAIAALYVTMSVGPSVGWLVGPSPTSFKVVNKSYKGILTCCMMICAKWWENRSKRIFGYFSPPPPKKIKKIGYLRKNVVNNEKIKVVQNCMKWRENWPKEFLYFLAPPPKKKRRRKEIGYLQHLFVNNEKFNVV